MKGTFLQKAIGVTLGLGVIFGVFYVASKAWSAGSKNADGNK